MSYVIYCGVPALCIAGYLTLALHLYRKEQERERERCLIQKQLRSMTAKTTDEAGYAFNSYILDNRISGNTWKTWPAFLAGWIAARAGEETGG